MRSRLASKALTERLRNRQVAQLTAEASQLSVRFTDGSVLVVATASDGLAIHVNTPLSPAGSDPSGPTPRQLDYLTFIAKYVQRFGCAPAEADIQRHFMVTPPSAHQMIVTLEPRGFISREPGVARSIRLLVDVPRLASEALPAH